MRRLMRVAPVACSLGLGLAVVSAATTPGAGLPTLVGGAWFPIGDDLCCARTVNDQCFNGCECSGCTIPFCPPLGCTSGEWITVCVLTVPGGANGGTQGTGQKPCVMEDDPPICQSIESCVCDAGSKNECENPF